MYPGKHPNPVQNFRLAMLFVSELFLLLFFEVTLMCSRGRRQAMAAPAQGFPVFALFLRRERNDWWNPRRAPILAQSYVCDKSRTGLPTLAGKQVFKINFNRHFNGRAKGPRNPGPQYNKLPDPDWMNKVQIVHRNRHHHAARVTMGHNGPGNIDQMHYLAAQDVAKRVGIVGQDHFHHFNFGLADCLSVPPLVPQFSTGSVVVQLYLCRIRAIGPSEHQFENESLYSAAPATDQARARQAISPALFPKLFLLKCL